MFASKNKESLGVLGVGVGVWSLIHGSSWALYGWLGVRVKSQYLPLTCDVQLSLFLSLFPLPSLSRVQTQVQFSITTVEFRSFDRRRDSFFAAIPNEGGAQAVFNFKLIAFGNLQIDCNQYN